MAHTTLVCFNGETIDAWPIEQAKASIQNCGFTRHLYVRSNFHSVVAIVPDVPRVWNRYLHLACMFVFVSDSQLKRASYLAFWIYDWLYCLLSSISHIGRDSRLVGLAILCDEWCVARHDWVSRLFFDNVYCRDRQKGFSAQQPLRTFWRKVFEFSIREQNWA